MHREHVPGRSLAPASSPRPGGERRARPLPPPRVPAAARDRDGSGRGSRASGAHLLRAAATLEPPHIWMESAARAGGQRRSQPSAAAARGRPAPAAWSARRPPRATPSNPRPPPPASPPRPRQCPRRPRSAPARALAPAPARPDRPGPAGFPDVNTAAARLHEPLRALYLPGVSPAT